MASAAVPSVELSLASGVCFATGADHAVLVDDGEGGGALSAGDLEELAPDHTGSDLAELQLALDGGIQGLDVVEDHGEGEETPRDGHRGEDDGAERH